MKFTTLLWIALGTFVAFALAAGLRSYSSNTKPEHARSFLEKHVSLEFQEGRSPHLVLSRNGEVLWRYDIESDETLDLSMSSTSKTSSSAAPLVDAAFATAFLGGTGAMTFQNLNTITQGKDKPTIAAVLLGAVSGFLVGHKAGEWWAERSVLNSFQDYLKPEDVLRLEHALLRSHRSQLASSSMPSSLPYLPDPLECREAKRRLIAITMTPSTPLSGSDFWLPSVEQACRLLPPSVAAAPPTTKSVLGTKTLGSNVGLRLPDGRVVRLSQHAVVLPTAQRTVTLPPGVRLGVPVSSTIP